MSNVKKFRIIKFKSKPILAAKSISKSFGGRVILRKIDGKLKMILHDSHLPYQK